MFFSYPETAIPGAPLVMQTLRELRNHGSRHLGPLQFRRLWQTDGGVSEPKYKDRIGWGGVESFRSEFFLVWRSY